MSDVYDITPYLRFPTGPGGAPARERRVGTSQPSGMLGRAVQLYCDGYLNTVTPTVSDISAAIERFDLVRGKYLKHDDMWDPTKVAFALELLQLAHPKLNQKYCVPS